VPCWSGGWDRKGGIYRLTAIERETSRAVQAQSRYRIRVEGHLLHVRRLRTSVEKGGKEDEREWAGFRDLVGGAIGGRAFL